MSLGKIAVVHFVSGMCCSHWADLCVHRGSDSSVLTTHLCTDPGSHALWAFGVRKHQLCHACAESTLAVPWMSGLHLWFVFSILPSPHSVFLCCRGKPCRADIAFAPGLVSMFPEHYRPSWAVWHRHWWVDDWSCRFTQNSLWKYMCCQNTWSCQVILKEHTALKMQKNMFYDMYNTLAKSQIFLAFFSPQF